MMGDVDAKVGVYEASAEVRFTITREGDGLVMRQAGAPAPTPLLAETPTKFFMKGQDFTFTFGAGSSGTIDKLVIDTGGATIEAKRRPNP